MRINERNTCCGVSPTTGVRILQASPQIASYRLNHLLVFVEKIGDRLQDRLQNQPLLQQLPIGKADLWIRGSRHVSTRRLGLLALQRFNITWRCLIKHLLQSAPVVQTALNLGYKLFRDVDGKPTPFEPPVEHSSSAAHPIGRPSS